MNKNSATYWLPRIAGIENQPKTEIVLYNHETVIEHLEGGTPNADYLHSLLNEVTETCIRIGFPCFIRTDLASAKHAGPKVFKITSPDKVRESLFETIMDSEMKFWIAEGGPKAILVREFLNLNSTLESRLGLPIAREFRFFANPEKVICHHPYWVEDAVKEFVDPIKDWTSILNHTNRPLTDEELTNLSAQAVVVPRNCGGGEWSVDFAQDENGKWWLIDCALAKDSWHQNHEEVSNHDH